MTIRIQTEENIIRRITASKINDAQQKKKMKIISQSEFVRQCTSVCFKLWCINTRFKWTCMVVNEMVLILRWSKQTATQSNENKAKQTNCVDRVNNDQKGRNTPKLLNEIKKTCWASEEKLTFKRFGSSSMLLIWILLYFVLLSYFVCHFSFQETFFLQFQTICDLFWCSYFWSIWERREKEFRKNECAKTST